MRYKSFESIPIDKGVISQSDLNIDIKYKNNIFQWNGQFSPQFVEVILKKYSKKGYRLLDPFLGSGTTLIEACKMGIDVVGIELNPAAYKLSKIYKFGNIPICEREKILHYLEENMVLKSSEIDSVIADDMRDVIDVFCLLCEKSEDDYKKQWSKLKEIILGLPFTNNEICIINGDSRYVELSKNNVDLLFTSPPYINVFNYHQQYRRSIENMGYNVLEIAKAEIGSNRKNRSNRFFSVIQYCIDIAIVIKNILEAMKRNSRMIFVVGRSSTILGLSFCNSRIIYEILVRIFRCKLVLRQERCFKNKYGEIIYEDILHFSASKDNVNREMDYYINYARKIGREYIHEKMIEVGEQGERYTLLNSAYMASKIIKES